MRQTSLLKDRAVASARGILTATEVATRATARDTEEETVEAIKEIAAAVVETDMRTPDPTKEQQEVTAQGKQTRELYS